MAEVAVRRPSGRGFLCCSGVEQGEQALGGLDSPVDLELALLAVVLAGGQDLFS